MVNLDSILYQPTSTILILLVSIGISFVSMFVYRLMTDLKKLRSINDEITRYNEKIKEAQRSGKSSEIRRARREEARIKMLASYATKQRLRVTLVTLLPFAAVSLLLGTLYGSRVVARFPFDTPLGRDLPFYVWYMFSYFAAYLPITRVFGFTMGTAVPLSSTRGGY